MTMPTSASATLPSEEVLDRIEATQGLMAADGLAGILAYADCWRTANVRYFTDFRPVDGVHDIALTLLFIPAAGEPVLFVGEGCLDYARSVTTFPAYTFTGLDSLLGRWAASEAAGKVGLAGAGLIPAYLRDELSRVLHRVPVEPTQLLARQKACKSPWELTQLREAARLTDLGMVAVREAVAGRAPISERDVARAADEAMIRAGADGPAYLSMVQSGPRSAFSLALPTDRLLEPGDLVMTDIGARYRNYVADGGRGFGYGPVSDAQRDVVEAAADAVQAGLDAARTGITAEALNSVIQQVLVDRGYGDYSSEAKGRGTGHGTGMDPEEELPWIGPGNKSVLQHEMVFTLKATITVPGVGGLRTERLVRLTADGVETLDDFPMRNYW